LIVTHPRHRDQIELKNVPRGRLVRCNIAEA